MLTLRQIEVIRAIMITGTIQDAAKLLGVSAPGVSRLMKYSERAMKVRLFERQHGRYVPTSEARDIFEQINGVYKKVDDLQATIARLERGEAHELRIATVPSIGNVMVPRAVERLHTKFPGLRIDVNILKIEEAIDYLLLRKGEVVAMSSSFDHPSIDMRPLATGALVCVTPLEHPLSKHCKASSYRHRSQ
jgi:DNA-binding transcriptional LysR family regulator